MLIAILYEQQLKSLQTALTFYKSSHPDCGWEIFPIATISNGIYTVLILGDLQKIFALVPAEQIADDTAIPIVALISPPRICPVCAVQGTITQLPTQNRSGYCSEHAEHNPVRKAKKQSPKTRSLQGL